MYDHLVCRNKAQTVIFHRFAKQTCGDQISFIFVGEQGLKVAWLPAFPQFAQALGA
jgi:hypothetical protein